MKFKYLDKRNYKMLVPKDLCIPDIMEELEALLVDLNVHDGLSGLSDKLINRNQNSNGQRTWYRYYKKDVDFGIFIDNLKLSKESRVIPQNRPEGFQRIVMHFRIKTSHGHEYDYKIPVQCLLKGWGKVDHGYQVYVHTLTYGKVVDHDNRLDANNNKVKEISYVGITSRSWLKRLDEHFAKVRKGTGYLFHQAIQQSISIPDMVYSHELFDLNLSYVDAMNIEEMLVDSWSTIAPGGFNMIPGGFRGIRELSKRRLMSKNLDGQEMLDKRDDVITKLIDREIKKGNPNPLLTDWWSNDDNYWDAMEKHSKRLSKEQVNAIWMLFSDGLSIEEIKEQVGALNERQVKGVLDEKHYKRELH